MQAAKKAIEEVAQGAAATANDSSQVTDVCVSVCRENSGSRTQATERSHAAYDCSTKAETHIHAYTQKMSYVHGCMHTCMETWMDTYIRVYTHACKHTHIKSNIHTNTRTSSTKYQVDCLSQPSYAYTRACIYTKIRTSTRPYNHTHIQIYMLTNIHKYNYTCIQMAAATAESAISAAKIIS